MKRVEKANAVNVIYTDFKRVSDKCCITGLPRMRNMDKKDCDI